MSEALTSNQSSKETVKKPKKLRCEMCNVRSVYSDQLLQQHLSSHSHRVNQFLMTAGLWPGPPEKALCPQKSSNGQRIFEFIDDHSGKIKCNACGKTCPPTEMIVHQRMPAHSEKLALKSWKDIFPIVAFCDICVKGFPTMVALTSHLNHNHDQNTSAKDEISPADPFPNTPQKGIGGQAEIDDPKPSTSAQHSFFGPITQEPLRSIPSKSILFTLNPLAPKLLLFRKTGSKRMFKTEEDLVTLCAPFGLVTKHLSLVHEPGDEIGVVEFATEEEAERMRLCVEDYPPQFSDGTVLKSHFLNPNHAQLLGETHQKMLVTSSQLQNQVLVNLYNGRTRFTNRPLFPSEFVYLHARNQSTTEEELFNNRYQMPMKIHPLLPMDIELELVHRTDPGKLSRLETETDAMLNWFRIGSEEWACWKTREISSKKEHLEALQKEVAERGPGLPKPKAKPNRHRLNVLRTSERIVFLVAKLDILLQRNLFPSFSSQARLLLEELRSKREESRTRWRIEANFETRIANLSIEKRKDLCQKLKGRTSDREILCCFPKVQQMIENLNRELRTVEAAAAVTGREDAKRSKIRRIAFALSDWELRAVAAFVVRRGHGYCISKKGVEALNHLCKHQGDKSRQPGKNFEHHSTPQATDVPRRTIPKISTLPTAIFLDQIERLPEGAKSRLEAILAPLQEEMIGSVDVKALDHVGLSMEKDRTLKQLMQLEMEITAGTRHPASADGLRQHYFLLQQKTRAAKVKDLVNFTLHSRRPGNPILFQIKDLIQSTPNQIVVPFSTGIPPGTSAISPASSQIPISSWSDIVQRTDVQELLSLFEKKEEPKSSQDPPQTQALDPTKLKETELSMVQNIIQSSIRDIEQLEETKVRSREGAEAGDESPSCSKDKLNEGCEEKNEQKQWRSVIKKKRYME